MDMVKSKIEEALSKRTQESIKYLRWARRLFVKVFVLWKIANGQMRKASPNFPIYHDNGLERGDSQEVNKFV